MANKQSRIPPFQEGYQTPPFNRAHETRRDNDTVKSPKITLYDIDYAIIYHLSQNMKLSVNEGGRSVEVPVLYADGEKWAQIKARGFVRDERNKVMAPMIAIRRSSVEPDSRIPIMDLNNRVPTKKFYPYITTGMQYDKLSGQLERKSTLEYYLVDVPNYVRVSYDLVVWTYMIEQMNTLVQSIIAVANHMWGDYHTFRVNINSATMNTRNDIGEDRLVSTDISLLVDGYLLEEFEYHEPTMRKAHTIKKVRFENEQEELNFYLDEPTIFNRDNHISREPKQVQLQNRKRNLRYRR